MIEGFELRFPSAQNAIDLVPPWTSYFPPTAGVQAGHMDLFHDTRIDWALEKFGRDVTGKTVLELGPLEGAHTWALAKRGAKVDAIEASRIAYLKCLVTKEILQIENARFWLGDALQWLENSGKRYDLVVACGVLYHMEDPMRMLRGLASVTNELYLWTVYTDGAGAPASKTETQGAVKARLYNVPYAPKDSKFLGGPAPAAHWMHKADIPAVLSALGFDSLEVAHDRPGTPQGAPATYSIYARRTSPGA